MTISFFVHGEPKGQPRPRAFAMKLGNGKYSARVFDSGTAENWKSAIAFEARRRAPDVAFAGPVAVKLVFAFARPKSHRRTNGELKPTAPLAHTGKPDADNLAKAVLDALTQLGGFWRDDSQVSSLQILKLYTTERGLPGVFISISEHFSTS